MGNFIQAVIPILVTITNTAGAAISTEITLGIRAHVDPFIRFHQQVATVILTALITTIVRAIITSFTLTVLTIALGSDHQTIITVTLIDLLTRI